MLSYEDMSDWMEGDKFVKPATYDIFIGVGAGGKKVTVKTEGITILTAEMLGMAKLADAVYCIRTEPICTETYTRYRVVACNTECCIQEYMYQLAKKDAHDEEYQDVWKIESMLDMAKRKAEVKNAEEAAKMLEEAKTSIEELNCLCKCK